MRLEMAQFLDQAELHPGHAISLRAYNLLPGSVILPSHGTVYGRAAWVVTNVERDHDREVVEVQFVLHSATMSESYFMEKSFDFNKEVLIVGLCVNPEDVNDMDFGV